VHLGNVRTDEFRNLAERIELLGGKYIGETVTNRREMLRCRCADGGSADICDHYVKSACVFSARGPLDTTSGFHARNLM